MAGITFIKCYYPFAIFCLLLINGTECQFKEGDECLNDRYRTKGACQKIQYCKKVLADFLDEDLTPQLCYYSRNEHIICCPGAKPSKKEIIRPKYRDSQFMCAEYSKSVFKLFDSQTIGGPPLNLSLCAHEVSPLIVGGETAKAAEFPHMALVGYDYKPKNSNQTEIKWGCGGSLISDIWVLTAAHCTNTQEFGFAKYVRLGELNFKQDNDETEIQDFLVAGIIKHPIHTYYKYNDIALMKLNTSAEFTKFVRPACLWTKPYSETQRAIATGWGAVKHNGKMNSHLLKVTLDLISKEQCDRFYRPSRTLYNGLNYSIQVCSGGAGKDTCQGDSGGPLQIFADDDFYCMYYVMGVTAFGEVCGLSAPGVFTRVSPYVQWIEEIVWNSVNDVLLFS